jgi:hypothetical protein
VIISFTLFVIARLPVLLLPYAIDQRSPDDQPPWFVIGAARLTALVTGGCVV